MSETQVKVVKIEALKNGNVVVTRDAGKISAYQYVVQPGETLSIEVYGDLRVSEVRRG